jgi:hypothetical protein
LVGVLFVGESIFGRLFAQQQKVGTTSHKEIHSFRYLNIYVYMGFEQKTPNNSP